MTSFISKKKKTCFVQRLSRLLQQIFLRTRDSWGPVLADESGRIV